jgi:hypothetical protein
MNSRFVGFKLHPLLSACRQLHASSLSVFGSAVSRPLDEVTDLDMHLVIPCLDTAAYAQIVAAAERSLPSPRTSTCTWRVELRHGPFKPVPGTGKAQLHLVIDDMGSLERSPWALRLHRAVTSHYLLGAPWLPGCSRVRQLREARRELLRWRDALVTRHIPFRWWRLERTPQLVEDRLPTVTDWDLRCALRGASTSADLHCQAALLTVRPMLGQLELDKRRQPSDEVLSHAIAILDSRLELLRGRRQ